MKYFDFRWLIVFLTAISLMQNVKAQEDIYLQEGFESEIFPPVGWTQINNGDGNYWTRTTYAPNVSEGNAAMQYMRDPYNSADVWMFTPAITLPVGEVEIRFDCKRGMDSEVEKLKVTVGTAATVAAQTNVLMSEDILGEEEYQEYTLTFSVTTAGDYYFAWNCFSEANKYALYVDKIIINKKPDCPHVKGLIAQEVSIHSVDLKWNFLENAGYEYVVVERGEQPSTGTPVSVTDTFATATGLEAYHEYDVYVRSTCQDDKVGLWSEPFSFRTKPLCPHISDLNLYGITLNTAIINWEANGNTSFQYAVGDQGFDVNIAETHTVNENMVELTGLLSAHSYDIYVRSACNEGDTGIWLGPLAFVTPSANCNMPNSLNVSNITGNSVDLEWSAVNDIERYELVYGVVGFNPDETTPVSVESTENTYALSNLASGTTYEVYIRTVCESGTALWLGPQTFATGCELITEFPYVETFDGEWNCWTKIDLNNNASPWEKKLGNGDVYAYTSGGSTNNNYLISPQFSVGENFFANFKYGSSSASSSIIVPVEIAISTTGPNPSDFQAVDTFFMTDNNWHLAQVDLRSYQGSNVYIAIHTIDAEVYSVNVHINDFKVEAIGDCVTPSNFELTETTGNSLSFVWEGWLDNQWEIAYGETGFALTEAVNVENVTESNYTLTGLNPSVNYDIYIRSKCSDSEHSDWVGPFTLATECMAISNFPYQQGFNSDDWACWTVIDADNDGRTWSKDNEYLGMSSNNYAAHGMGSQNDYLITPQINVGENYLHIEWMDKVEDSGRNNTYTVLVSTTGNNIADFTDYITSFDCTNEDWTSHTINLESYRNQTIYVAFHQTYSASTSYGFGIDSLKIAETPPCSGVSLVEANNITTSSAELSWMPGQVTSWDIAYGISGTLMSQMDSVLDVTNYTNYTLTNLTSGSIYDVYIRQNCDGQEEQEWAGPFSFKTLCLPVSDFPYQQDFNLDDWACWTVIDADNDGITWSKSQTYLDMENGNYAAHGMGNQNDYLITPKISVGNLNLFATWFDKVESSYQPNKYTIRISTTGTDIADFTDSIISFDCVNTNWIERSLDLSAYANQEIYIAFHQTYSAATNYGFGIDNFKLAVPPTCIQPESLDLESRTSTTLTVDWEEMGSATAWDFKVFTTDAAEPVEPTYVNITDKPYTISGLSVHTSYKIKVRAHCSDSDLSEWSDVLWEETTIVCPKPDNTQVNSLTSNSAVIKWNGYDGTTFDVELRLKEDLFTGVPTHTGITTDSLLAQGLQHSTLYKYRIRNICNPDEGQWSDSTGFKTLCGVYEMPFAEGFGASALPECWLHAKGELGEPLEVVSYGSWSPKRFAYGTNPAFKVNIYGTTKKAWLMTPEINLGTSNNAILEFDLALTLQGEASQADTIGIDDKFGVFISTGDDEVWDNPTPLAVWDNQGSELVYNHISTTGEHIVIDLSAYSGNVRIGFYGESTVKNSDNDLFIDSVSVRENTCIYPVEMTLGGLTNTTAVVDWENPLGTTKWDIKVVNTETNDELVIEDITEKPYTITNLTAEASYQVYIRTDCGASGNANVSEWSPSNVIFTTLADCPAPNDVVFTVAQGTSINASWEAYFATQWDLEWVQRDISPTGTPMADNVDVNNYTISGLIAQTDYDLYLRTDCGGTTSEWMGPFTFNSGCDMITEFPWEEKFEDWDNVTTCWDLSGGNEEVVQYADSVVKAAFDDWGDGKYAYLKFPSLDISSLSNPYLEFTWSHKYESWNVRDLLALQVSTDGVNWTNIWVKVLADFNSNDGASTYNAGSYVSSGLISLEGYGASPELRFCFKSDEGSNCFIDNVGIRDIPCVYPQSITSFDVLANAASVTWTFLEQQTQWQVQYGATGFELGQGTSVDADNDTLELSGLIANTQYDAYVRSVCTTDSYSDWTGPVTFRTPNNIADFISFSVQNQVGTTTIDLDNKTINLQVTHSQSLEDLMPEFELSDNAKIKVGEDVQISGQSTLDFTNPVVYIVTSEDSVVVNNWTVTITKVPLLSENDFISFSIQDVQIGEAVIDTDNHTVKDTVDYQADLSNLIAQFTISPSASIKIGATEQVSGTTPNDFSSSVTYTIVAEDGTEQDWEVTLVKELPCDSTDFLTFDLDGQNGVIDSENHTITVDVAWDTDLSNMLVSFTLSDNAIAKIGDVYQYSGCMYHSFYDSKVYTVVAENGTTTQDWTVIVNKAEIPQGALCSNPIPLTLDAQGITGTTEGFGNNYQYDNILQRNEIIYRFDISQEEGTLSGSITFGNNDDNGTISVYNGVPGLSTTECLVNASPASNETSCEFNNVTITSGVYYLIVSRNSYYGTPAVSYTFNLSYVETLSDEADILSYSIDGQVSSDIITEDKKVKVVMPYGTDLSSLVAEFTLSEGATAKVADVEQVSGTTANNWAEATTGYISYSVTAEDNSTIKGWKVYVTTEPNTENDILTYTIPEQLSSDIDTENRKITVVMPAGHSLNNLVPEFTLSDEATAKVAGVLQESGVTSQNWSIVDFIEYVVSAGNGDAQTWKVYVENAPNSAAEIEEFELVPGVQVGTTEINSEEAKILVKVTDEANLTDLIIFKLRASEGATVTYQGNEVVPQSTSIDLSESVILVVTAEDGTVKEWEVIRMGSVPLISSSTFSVYPNPTTGVLNIRSDIDKAEWLSIEVINTSGQIVKHIAQKDIDNAIDLSEQANGLYLIKVNTTKGNVVKKINLIK